MIGTAAAGSDAPARTSFVWTGVYRATMHPLTKAVLFVAVVIAGVVIAAVAPATAVPASSQSDTISGYEYWATSTDGRFAGTASGALAGGWSADVRHTALCLSCAPTATITGGRFALLTAIHKIPRLVTGSFTGGAVQVVNRGTHCTKQTFTINGILSKVASWSGGNGNGTFAVTLTHFRHPAFGSCITYGASVNGTLSLTL
jgi:hypothetical protein